MTAPPHVRRPLPSPMLYSALLWLVPWSEILWSAASFPSADVTHRRGKLGERKKPGELMNPTLPRLRLDALFSLEGYRGSPGFFQTRGQPGDDGTRGHRIARARCHKRFLLEICTPATAGYGALWVIYRGWGAGSPCRAVMSLRHARGPKERCAALTHQE